MTIMPEKRTELRKIERYAEMEASQRRATIRSIMSEASGRAWILDLLNLTHMFHTSFNGNALQSAFAEGERNIGLRLFNDILAASPNEYILMMRERNEKDLANDARRRNGNTAAPGLNGDPSGSEQADGDAGSS